MDAVSANSVSIADLDQVSYRLPDDRMISMNRDNENLSHQIEKESLTMRNIFAGLGLTVEEYASLVDQAKLAADLTGEP